MNLDGLGEFFGNAVDRYADYRIGQQQAEARENSILREAAVTDQRIAAAAAQQSVMTSPTLIWVGVGAVVLLGAVLFLRRR